MRTHATHTTLHTALQSMPPAMPQAGPSAAQPAAPTGAPAPTQNTASLGTTPSQPATTPMFRGPYRPFLDPLPLHEWWYALLFPIAVLTAIAYKSVRTRTREKFVAETAVFAGQIIIGMFVLGIGVYVLLGIILPRIAPMGGV